MDEPTKIDWSKATKLPDGCECRLDFYLVSDSAGVEVVVGAGAMTAVPPAIEAGPALALARSLGAAVGVLEEIADDWRAMSREEIDDYKRRQSLEETDEPA